MDKNRIWVLGSVLIMAVVVTLGFLLGIQPQLKAAAAARADALAVESLNAQQAAVLDRLKLEFAGIDDVRAELGTLNKSVPTGTEIPAFVDQLSDLAAQSQVTVAGITVADAVGYVPVVAPVVAAPVVEVEEGEPAEPTAAEPAPASTAGIPHVVDPLITPGNFASLEVQITLSGGYNGVLDFVAGLQTGSRLFLVSGVNTVAVADAPTVDPDSDAPAPPKASGLVDATITGLVYVLVPAGESEVAAAE